MRICSQCDFTSNFESALSMHRQLHHEVSGPPDPGKQKKTSTFDKKISKPESPTSSICSKKGHGLRLGSRTSSATRILGKLRAKICRTKVLSTHPEDPLDFMFNSDLSCRSDCTSKALNLESPSSPSRISARSQVKEFPRDTYICHLCSFNADRITVLDRHLLTDHKIGLENLLKLVLAKTKDGLAEDNPMDMFGVQQPYYNPIGNGDVKVIGPNHISDGEEFIIQTTKPKITIVKHSSTNTELSWSEVLGPPGTADLRNSCQMISTELDKMIKYPARTNKDDLLEKMQALNEYMCKFVDSSNTLKKALSRDVDGKYSSRKEKLGTDETTFQLRLEDQETPRTKREWERAHSEKLDRFKCKHNENIRNDRSKLSAESYYF